MAAAVVCGLAGSWMLTNLHAGLCTGLVVHCTSLCSLHNVLFFVPVWKGINLPCRKLFSFALLALFEFMIVEPLLLAEVWCESFLPKLIGPKPPILLDCLICCKSLSWKLQQQWFEVLQEADCLRTCKLDSALDLSFVARHCIGFTMFFMFPFGTEWAYLSVGVGHCLPNPSSCLLNHYFLPKFDLHAGLCNGLVVHCTSLCLLHNVFIIPFGTEWTYLVGRGWALLA